jgi:hypothetical protein
MDKGATHVRMKVTELMTDAELITPTEEKIEEQGRQLTNANETDRYRGKFEEAKGKTFEPSRYEFTNTLKIVFK